jgi:hypothetical protein
MNEINNYVTLRNLIKRGVVSSNADDSKAIPASFVNYSGKTDIPCETIMPYGLYCIPPVNTPMALFSFIAVESNLGGIPYSQKIRFKNLQPGDVVVGNPVTGAYIKFATSNNVTHYYPQKITVTSVGDFKVESGADVDFTETVGKNKFNNLQVTGLPNHRLLASISSSGDVGHVDLIDWIHSSTLVITSDGNGGVNIELPP